MPLYLINPRKSTRRRSKAGKLFGAAKAAFLRRMAKGRRKKSGARPTRAKRTRRVASTPHRGVIPMARKRKSARKATKRRRRPVARKASPVRRRRRKARRSSSISFRRVRGAVYARNPGGFSVKGAIATLKQGAKDAAAVVAGEAVVNYVGRKIADKIPGEASMAKTLAVRAALAIGVGVVAQRAVGRDAARFAVAGALASPVKTLLRTVIPADSEIATALASDEELGAYYEGVGAYVDAPPVVGKIGPGGVDRSIGAMDSITGQMAGMY